VKRETFNRNKTSKLADVQRLVSEATDKATAEDCEKCVRHANRLQEEDFL
jgi:hypothetical protein